MFYVAPLFAFIFSLFPLTDTDIWWHLACGNNWVTTWTPVRTPIVNVHAYFQQVVSFVYNIGGAPLLVIFKAFLWGIIFAIFLPKHLNFKNPFMWGLAVLLLFIFRYHFEMRPIVFTLLFLGLYKKMLPQIFVENFSKIVLLKFLLLLVLQFLWCKFQGLFILGPIFIIHFLLSKYLVAKLEKQIFFKIFHLIFLLILLAVPFLHKEGLLLFVYPFGLLNRLLGMTESAVIFANGISENISPFRGLFNKENQTENFIIIAATLFALCSCVKNFARIYLKKIPLNFKIIWLNFWLISTAILSLIAVRNFVLFLPIFLNWTWLNFGECNIKIFQKKFLAVFFVAFIFGLWAKSILEYDGFISKERVPLKAAIWMQKNPHTGKLFNDDRLGGYLSFTNPSDSIYLDGRFILKSADFFERYLSYSVTPKIFFEDADSLNIDRVALPIKYFSRWDKLITELQKKQEWDLAYQDDFFVVFDKKF